LKKNLKDDAAINMHSGGVAYSAIPEPGVIISHTAHSTAAAELLKLSAAW
jgi:hypothetical protein